MKTIFFYLLIGTLQAQTLDFLVPFQKTIASDITNLKYWSRATTIQQSFSVGTDVTIVSDESGNSADRTPSASTRRPAMAQVNGLYCLDFVANDNIQGVNAKFDFLHQADFTQIWVIRPKNDNATTYLFDSANGTTGSVGRSTILLATAKLQDDCYSGSAGNNVFSSQTANNAFAKDVFHIVVSRYRVASNTFKHELWIDNQIAISSQGVASFSAATSTFTPTWFCKKDVTNGTSAYLVEDMGFSRSLTDNEIYRLTRTLSIIYNIQTIPFPRFVDNGKTINIPSSEVVIESGFGLTDDYIAYVTQAISPVDGLLAIAYKKGSTHSGTSDIIVRTCAGQNSSDLSTWSLVSFNSGKVFDRVDYSGGGGYLTDPSIGITSTGRIICFATHVQSTGAESFFRYSDNNGSSWSTAALVGYALPAYQISVNSFVQIGTKIYLACHYTANASTTEYSGLTFVSSDNGATWTQYSTIYPTDSNHIHEPWIGARSDGMKLVIARSDIVAKGMFKISWDDFTTFSGFWNKYPNHGSPTACWMPSGGLITSGRNNGDNRTMINYFSDGGGRNYSTDYLDSRTGTSVKSSVIYSSKIGAAVIVYCTEMNGTDNYTNLVCKTLTEN